MNLKVNEFLNMNSKIEKAEEILVRKIKNKSWDSFKRFLSNDLEEIYLNKSIINSTLIEKNKKSFFSRTTRFIKITEDINDISNQLDIELQNLYKCEEYQLLFGVNSKEKLEKLKGKYNLLVNQKKEVLNTLKNIHSKEKKDFYKKEFLFPLEEKEKELLKDWWVLLNSSWKINTINLSEEFEILDKISLYVQKIDELKNYNTILQK